jgi:hypothetical protein
MQHHAPRIHPIARRMSAFKLIGIFYQRRNNESQPKTCNLQKWALAPVAQTSVCALTTSCPASSQPTVGGINAECKKSSRAIRLQEVICSRSSVEGPLKTYNLKPITLKSGAPAWDREPRKVRLISGVVFTPERGVIHPSFPLRGRWERSAKISKQAPSPSLCQSS